MGMCAPTLDVVEFLVEYKDEWDVTFASWILRLWRRIGG